MDIKLTNLSFAYSVESVFTKLNISFPEGNTTVLMGPSGSGKTTLLYLLMGLLSPADGKMSGIPDRFSAVFQEDRLCEAFSAVSNLCLIGASAEQARTALSELGLGEHLTAPVREYSGGMKRRVAIARAMLAQGEAIFMDEPLKGLDEHMKSVAADFIKSNLRGRTLIAVSHDAHDALLLEGKVVNMENL